MPTPEQRSPTLNSALLTRLGTVAWCAGISWCALLALSLSSDVRRNYRHAEDFARATARAAHEKDVGYRRWVAKVGGVYITAAGTNGSAPHTTEAPDTAPTTTTGERLTRLSPDHLSRLVGELDAATGAPRGCITSAHPLRAENAADDWEAAALRALAAGAGEAATVITVDGEPVLRLMKPLRVDETCLTCHADQGLRPGDLRGGLSTTVSLKPYYETARDENRSDILFHAALALGGLAVIILGRKSFGRALAGRDQAHAALAESVRRHHQLIETLPLVSLTCTLDGLITHANPALLALSGYTRAEVIGHDFFELLVAPAQRAAARATLQRFVESGGGAAPRRDVLVDRTGQPHTINWIHTLVTDAQGRPVGLTSLGEDVTVRTAEELRQRLLSCAVEQSPAVVVITDAAGTIEYVNARFTAVTGYTAAEALGQNPRLLSSRTMPVEFYRTLWETILAGREWHGVFHNRRKNGEHFWESARISPIRDDTGTVVRFIALKEDITAQRHAEQALAESEQRFRTLVESAPVAVIVHSHNRCHYANTCAHRLFGYADAPSMVGAAISEHVLPESLPVVAERSGRLDQGLTNPAVELALRRRDGSPVYCESIAARINYNNEPATLSLLVDITERRQMLSALEESEARYRALVEVAPVAIFSLDQGRFTFANPGTARLLGFAQPMDLVGTSLWQYVHADSLARVTELLAGAEAGREMPSADLRLVRRDRAEVVCATLAVPMGAAPQRSVLVLARDITEYKKLEDTLRENEARMRETLETTAAGYFLLDRDDRLLHANSAFLEFFEQPTLAAARGRRFPELLPTPAGNELAPHLRRLAGGEEFVGGQIRLPRANGTTSFFSFTAHLVRQGNALAGSEGFILDTTAARASEERYQMLSEQMLDGFALHEIIGDADGRPTDYRYLAVNPAFERLVGRTAAEIAGRTARELFPTLEAKWIARYGKVALTGEPLAVTDYSAAFGRHFEVAAFRPAPGRFACLVRDVTDRQRLTLQLQQAQKMEAVGQLAGGVAHDYNNILVAILMNLALLRNETGLRPETAESLLELEREAKRAATLTRQLLVFSRRQAVQAVRLDFNEQLEQILALLRRLLGEHITIVSRLAPALPPLLADPGMIDQVVMNLCVNARDAMPAGGRLELATGLASFDGASPAHPSARAGEFLHFAVADNGCGMDEITRERVFEPFFTTKEAGKGTGLGLATVLSIVQQHQGWIEVDSAPGQGSTFHVYLPAADAIPEPPRPLPDPAATTTGTETILLVEDDPIARQTISLTLRRNGYRVVEAQTVAAALAAWAEKKNQIAALITDVVMPGGQNGLQLAQLLHAERPGLSIVIISGYSTDAVRTTPIVEGAVYLSKPFDYETLTRTLRSCLGRSPA